MNFTTFNFGPQKTPLAIKIILALTIFFSLFLAIAANSFLVSFFSLNYGVFSHWHIWQIFTNLFILPSYAISAGFLFHLAFNLYLIWVLGSSIIDLKSYKNFLLVFCTSILTSSVFAAFIITYFFPSKFFFGANLLIYSLAILWLNLHKNAKLLLFFSLPFQAKWLISFIIAFNLLSLLSKHEFVYFLTYLFTIALTYVLSQLSWQTTKIMSWIKKNLSLSKPPSKKKNYYHESKIYDITTGEPILSDEEFLEAIKVRISLYGEEILTEKERTRREKILKSKNR